MPAQDFAKPQSTGVRPSSALPANEPEWARGEDERLITGQAQFVGDLDRDDQLHLRVVRSPIAHGRLKAISLDGARAAPGVELVISSADLEEVHQVPMRVTNRPSLAAYEQPVLARSVVRYVGEPLAVVVARTPREAEYAADLVELDIDPLEPTVSVDAAQTDPVWEDAPDGRLCTFVGKTGDFSEAARFADLVVTHEFETARDTGLPLETRGLLAEWDADEGRVHLWGPTKFVRFTRATVADWFGLELEQVVCHHVDVGGMFGSRGELYPEDYLVPLASRLLGKPVKWIEDRNEHFLSINHSRGQKHSVSVAVSSEGKLLALKDEILQDFGAYARPIGGRLVEIPVEAIPGPYRWPVIDLVCHAVATNKTPMGTMRGPGTFDAGFVRERALDIVAARLGMDPVEFRRRNLIQPEEMPYVQLFGPEMHPSTYDSGDFPLTLDKLLTTIDVDAIRDDIRERRRQGELIGFGLGLYLAHAGLGVEESIKLEVSAEGRLEVLTAGSEIGQGLATMLRTVASEALGIAQDLIDVTTNSTERFDGGSGTYSARSTIFSGSALHNAAVKLRAQLHEDYPAADSSDPAWWRKFGRREVVGTHRQEHPTFGFGAHAAVVRLDQETLTPTVERLAVAYDCGRAIDPPSLKGQLAGAAVQGLGGTFFQELDYDERAQPQSTTFMDYLIPTIHESPSVEVVLLELPGTTSNPLGVKGGGEAGIMGVGGALSNAVADALCVPESISRLPITADAILPFVTAVPGEDGKPPSVREPVEDRRSASPRWLAKVAKFRPIVSSAAVAGAALTVGWLLNRRRQLR